MGHWKAVLGFIPPYAWFLFFAKTHGHLISNSEG